MVVISPPSSFGLPTLSLKIWELKKYIIVLGGGPGWLDGISSSKLLGQRIHTNSPIYNKQIYLRIGKKKLRMVCW